MNFIAHQTNPTDLVESAFFRIQQVRMAGVPIMNEALSVEAVDFQRWQGHWLGVLITPWCMSLLLVPGQTDDWESVSENRRRFIHFPAGDFAFLGTEEDELGEFQSCSLFSPMDRFGTQAQAVQAARASLMALLTAPVVAEDAPPAPEAPNSPSRRRFFAPFLRGVSEA